MINVNNLEKYNEDEKTNYLIHLEKKALEFFYLHTYDYRYEKMLSTYSIIPLIIISTFTGTATIFQPYVHSKNQSLYLIIIGCSNIIAGLLTLLKEYIRRFHMEKDNGYVAFPFRQLSYKIRLHLQCKEEDRENDEEFIIRCKEQFDNIIENSPGVSKYAIDKLEKQLRSQKTAKYEMAADQLLLDHYV